MFIVVLFALNIILFIYILFYGLCLLSLPFVKPLRTGEQEEKAEVCSQDEIAIVVPSHYEGEGLLGTIDSLLGQEYEGILHIHIMLRDPDDSSFPFLKDRYGFEWNKKKAAQIIFENEKRRVELHCCGFGPKKDKLNYIIPRLETSYIGLLDADHRAEPGWIRRSLARLEGSAYVGVQSRREPLSLKKIPQLWDSAQNHIGNELVNRAMKKVVGSVFFTGTTALFRGKALREQPFGDCVTEDTYLSYELLAKKQLIDYEPETGSKEEVAPDLRSYIARRRRWSCGHNKTFFSLAGKLLKTDLHWRKKASTAIHGLFYTVPVAVVLLLNLYSLQMFVQYTARVQLLVLLCTAVLSYCTSVLFFGRDRSLLREFLTSFFLLLPQLSLLTPIPLYLLEHELFYFLTAFPYAYYLVWFHSFCLLAPLLLLLFGYRKIPLISKSQLAFIAVSYPLFFILDLYACLLGFVDFVMGRPTWSKIQRTFVEESAEQGSVAGMRTKIVRGVGACAALVFLVIGANDLSAYSNCGKAQAYLFEPVLFPPRDSITWELERHASLKGDERIEQEFRSSLLNFEGATIEVSHFVDGVFLEKTASEQKRAQMSTRVELPLGWESHEYTAKLKSNDQFCQRSLPFTSRLIELRGKSLFVNAEPFLIKGVIPSFTPKQTSVETAAGYEQIKALGANSIRLYHAPTSLQKESSQKHNLLLIDQPDRSTWDDVNLSLLWSRKLLKRRYFRLLRESRDNPFVLFHNVGNELELRSPRKNIPKLRRLMLDVEKDIGQTLTSYATFFVFLKLPTMVYGINMLDSGQTYWRDGLRTVQALDKAFYASEYGGFVAAFESTPPSLRAYRLFEYERRLREANALGMVVHQSHDNWAQAVIDGFNDPFTPDQPDDLRGIWDRENKPKLVKRFVEMLFSDLEVEVESDLIPASASEFRVTLHNRRAFKLRNVILFRGETDLLEPFSLEPGESKSFKIPLGKQKVASQVLKARYSTHKGLQMQSVLHFQIPLQSSQPVLLNRDSIMLNSSPSALQAELLQSEELKVYLPEHWEFFEFNGQRLRREQPLFRARLRSAMDPVRDLAFSADAKSWRTLALEHIGRGPQRMRFKLSNSYPKGAKLILAGLGAKKIHLRYGETAAWQEFETHNYRENIFDLDELRGEESPGEYIYALIPRSSVIFVSAQDHPLKEVVPIRLETPRVFSPVEVKLRKVE